MFETRNNAYSRFIGTHLSKQRADESPPDIAGTKVNRNELPFIVCVGRNHRSSNRKDGGKMGMAHVSRAVLFQRLARTMHYCVDVTMRVGPAALLSHTGAPVAPGPGFPVAGPGARPGPLRVCYVANSESMIGDLAPVVKLHHLYR